MVDTSALACILLCEPDFERYEQLLGRSDAALLPAHCYLEFALLRHLGDDSRAWLDQLMESSPISLVAFQPEHGAIAADAAAMYGKGRRHPAQLNFGECITYAIAKHRRLPLLYHGNDFRLTDIESALASE